MVSSLALDEIRLAQALGTTSETWLNLGLFQRTGVVFANNARAGFELAARLAEQEGGTTTLGPAAVGLELCEQIPGGEDSQ